jgi:ABC-type lipoprotein release transport system permease subunit
MNLILKLAWRNIGRNRRRTLITTSSIVMAVLLSIVMGSMQYGSYDQMIDNSVGSFVGHLQIQHLDYLDEPTLDHSFDADSSWLTQIISMDGITAAIPRIDAYALAAGADRSRATMVIGIDPKLEHVLSDPESKLIDGTYFTSDTSHSVIITEGLASFLNLAVGDSLVLLGQGYQGMSANGLFPIQGIIRFGLPELNKGLVYLPIVQARELYAMPERSTSVSVILDRPTQLDAMQSRIRDLVPAELAVHGWPTLMPDLVQAIEVDYASSLMILAILYLVVGFGILGTVLMMTTERRFEFGVLMSIGTPRATLSTIFVVEMLLIALLGAGLGMLLSLPVVLWFHYNPIYFSGEMAETILQFGMEPYLQFSTDPTLFVLHASIVFGLTILISLYPVWHLNRMKPITAMRR